MRIIYPFIIILAFAHGLKAQVESFNLPVIPYQISEPKVADHGNLDRSPRFKPSFRSIGWTEDFSSGLNSTNGQWTTSGTHGDVWKRVDSIAPFCYSDGANDWINFTTESNGFTLFHADSVNCINPDTVPVLSSDSLLTGSLISPSIDLSQDTAVSVYFQQRFRFCCTQEISLLLSVSNDGGESWTDFEVSGNTAVDEYNVNTIEHINITAIAAGHPDVRLKFTWNATSTASQYFWAIDDIVIGLPPENDLVAINAKYGSYDPMVDTSFKDLEYSIYPISQVRPLDFSVLAANIGTETQTNVYLQVVIRDENEQVSDTVTNELISIPPADTIELIIDNYDLTVNYDPLFSGDGDKITLTYSIHQEQEDAFLLDNQCQRYFKISTIEQFNYFTSDYFARDRGFPQFATDVGTGLEYMAMMGFHFSNDPDSEVSIMGIGAAISDSSDIGKTYNFYLYDENMQYIDETITEDLTGDDIYSPGFDNYSYLPLISGPYCVTPGKKYFAAIHHFEEGDGEKVTIGIENLNAPDSTSFVKGYFDDQGCWDPVCMTNASFMIRLVTTPIGVNCNVGIDSKNPNTDLSLFPNPTTGQTTVNYTLLEQAEIAIEVYDLNGKLVFDKDLGTVSVGEHRFQHNFSGLVNGVYSVRMLVDETATTQKLILAK